jgi:hypothetical protein
VWEALDRRSFQHTENHPLRVLVAFRGAKWRVWYCMKDGDWEDGIVEELSLIMRYWRGRNMPTIAGFQLMHGKVTVVQNDHDVYHMTPV